MGNLGLKSKNSVAKRFAVVLFSLCVLLSGCKTITNISGDDPLEPLNRSIFGFNEGVDQVILRPTAIAYKELVPDSIRSGIRNVLRWLNGPVIVINDLAQANLDQAKNDSLRFLMNTTSLGFIDIASDFNIKYKQEDFGQTLGSYGVPSGPYLVFPLLGPSNTRDAIGRVVDYFLNPFSYVGNANSRMPYTVSKNILSAVSFRSENFEQIDDLRSSSLDAYAKVRTIYRQQRRSAINNGKAPVNISAQDPSKLFEESLTFSNNDVKTVREVSHKQIKNVDTK
ncbi:MAG: VacJ family lipoprotein [Rhodospirillaceae bacterium]|nr:VacJ family lipoprotein [Rhodospirillaceae bacterium]